MGFFSRIDRHAELFRGMMDRMGVDFATRVQCHPETVGEYRTAVLSCSACKSGTACAAWQQAHDSADRAPDFCRNRSLLNALGA